MNKYTLEPSTEPKPLKLKFPKSLALLAAPRGACYLRCLAMMSYIKALWPDRPMPDNSSEGPKARRLLASESKYSVKQVDRILIRMHKHNLISRYRMRGLECISWDKVREEFGITHEHMYHFHNKVNVRLYDILDKKVESEKKNQCAVAAHNRVKANPFLKEIIKEVTGREKINLGAVAEHQLSYLLSKGQAYRYTADADMVLSTVYRGPHSDKEKEKIFRGDTSLSSRSMSKLYALKGHGSMAYKKRKWLRLGLCNIYSRVEPVANGLYTKSKDRKHRIGYLHFNHVKGQTELIMPDLIEDLPLQSLDTRFERIAVLIAWERLAQMQQKLAS